MSHHKKKLHLNQPPDGTIVQPPDGTIIQFSSQASQHACLQDKCPLIPENCERKLCSLEAEQSVLGCLMLEEFDDHDNILAELAPADFVTDTRHPIILIGIKKCRENGLKPLFISVCERLIASGDLTRQNQAYLGGYIGQLFRNNSTANIDFYAKKTKEYVFKRGLCAASIEQHEALLMGEFKKKITNPQMGVNGCIIGNHDKNKPPRNQPRHTQHHSPN